MMRILLASHYYPPHVGGIENVVRNEAVHLARAGAEVTVLTSGPKTATVVEDGVRVVRIAAWNGAEARAGVPFPVLSPRVLTAALRWARWADVVHVHDCLYVTSWASGLAAALTRTPQVLTQHVALVEHPSPLVRAVQRGVYAVAGRALVRRARRVLVLNDRVAAFVAGHGARTGAVRHLANGVDTETFQPARTPAERDAARERFHLPQPRPGALRRAAGTEEGVRPAAGRRRPDGVRPGLRRRRQRDHRGPPRRTASRGPVPRPAGRPLPGLRHLRPALHRRRLPADPPGGDGLRPAERHDRRPGLRSVRARPHQGPAAASRRGPVARDAEELAADEPLRAVMGHYSRTYATAGFSWGEHTARLLTHYGEAIGRTALPRGPESARRRSREALRPRGPGNRHGPRTARLALCRRGRRSPPGRPGRAGQFSAGHPSGHLRGGVLRGVGAGGVPAPCHDREVVVQAGPGTRNGRGAAAHAHRVRAAGLGIPVCQLAHPPGHDVPPAHPLRRPAPGGRDGVLGLRRLGRGAPVGQGPVPGARPSPRSA